MILLSSIIVADVEHPTRFSDYAFEQFQKYIPSRKGIKKQIKKGCFYLNEKQANSGDWINTNDVIELFDLEENPPKPYPLELEMIFEDEYISIINKPPGISASGNEYRTIQNAVVNQITIPEVSDKLKWPRPVHRLDNLTSGLLIIAKTKTALIEFSKLFETKSIQKKYLALVIGRTKESGIINLEIDGKAAISEYSTLQSIPSLANNNLSLIELSPKTGRTHQLRIHLQSIGHPIMGDKIYGTTGQHIKGKGLFLCAKELSFTHPITNYPTKVAIDIPNKFVAFINNEKTRFNKLRNRNSKNS